MREEEKQKYDEFMGVYKIQKLNEEIREKGIEPYEE